MEILKYPHPCLRRKCREVERIDKLVVDRVAEMFQTMYDARGVGLAASQVGWDARLCIVNSTGEADGEMVFINPVIVEAEGTVEEEEGCLSVPGINKRVRRAERIRVRAFDLKGEQFELESDGLLAIALQHESDHLDGKLFISKLTRSVKEAIAPRLKELEESFKAAYPGAPTSCLM